MGIETRTGVSVASIDGFGVTLASGTVIPAATVVWCAGMLQQSRRDTSHAADNIGVDAQELAAKILEAIRSGRDLYLYDRYIIGPDAVQRAREVLIEKCNACSEPDEVAFLTSVIRLLED